ncbi:DUF4249 domain-containing protein [Pedobacter frigoris]|uniref:DUF4249 domain-containing protein n=1 Tax=Pedobacter frigoris TaxID=2571272 RepID=UPI00292D34CD|nr:DUF4249 domain-containing protein [Pedobacter frigoris]
MMNRIFNIMILFALLMSFSGCEEVIDLKLDDAPPAVVIDGGLSDQNEIQVVKVSTTYNFSESNRFNGAKGAKVVLISSTGNTYNYSEVSPGIYNSPAFRGRSGVTYTLNVTLNNKTYTASSIMPAKVNLDSLTFKEFSFFGQSNTYIAANYKDPGGIQNQYRYVLKAKGVIEEDAVSEDRFDDGNNVANVIFYELNDLVAGDLIDVEFQCIDRNVYRYFFSLNQTEGGGGPPVAPANPPSNFNNGALGVFNAHTSSKKTIVLK